MVNVPVLSEIKLEVTYKCNLACIHCSSDAGPSSPLVMSPDECFQVINEAISLGVKKIVFSGGEPLLWPSLTRSVQIASSGGMEVTIYTSGNVDGFHRILDELESSGLKRIIFSVFGTSANEHDEITRIGGSFQTTREAAEFSVSRGLRVELHFVPLSTNFKELEGIVKFSNEWGVSQVSVLRFVPQGRGTLLRNRSLDKLQNVRLRNLISRLRSEGHQIRLGSPYNFFMLNDQPECLAGIDRLIVGPDFRIYPCDAFKQVRAEEVVGTLDYSSLTIHTLDECWEKSPFLNVVREYLGTPFDEPCLSCSALQKCFSGCLAQKVILNGDFIKRPDPMCLMSE